MPTLMFSFRKFGRTHLLANLMQGCQTTCGHNDQPEYDRHKTIYPRTGMFGRWHQFRLIIDTSNQGGMSIFFNGAPLVRDQSVTFPTQHRPYVRLGIYRAGDLSGNVISMVDWRVSIKRACEVLRFDRSRYQQKSRRSDPLPASKPTSKISAKHLCGMDIVVSNMNWAEMVGT